MACFNKLNAIVLTGGMGTKNIDLRKSMLNNLDFLGISLDKNLNSESYDREALISTSDSKVNIYTIPTDEDFEIYTQCKKKLLMR